MKIYVYVYISTIGVPQYRGHSDPAPWRKCSQKYRSVNNGTTVRRLFLIPEIDRSSHAQYWMFITTNICQIVCKFHGNFNLTDNFWLILHHLKLESLNRGENLNSPKPGAEPLQVCEYPTNHIGQFSLTEATLFLTVWAPWTQLPATCRTKRLQIFLSTPRTTNIQVHQIRIIPSKCGNFMLFWTKKTNFLSSNCSRIEWSNPEFESKCLGNYCTK